jgi:hypothetical protein
VAIQKIPQDAVVEDVLATLANPEEYLRGAFEHLHQCYRERGAAVLRIGIMGRGIVPHYRVEYPHQRPRFFEEGEETDFNVVGAFNGRNHKPLVPEGEEPEILRDEHWSERATTYAKVRELLGQLRGYKHKVG